MHSKDSSRNRSGGEKKKSSSSLSSATTNNHNNNKKGQKTTTNNDNATPSRTPKVPCTYYMKGNCSKGNSCPFLHDPLLRNQSKQDKSIPSQSLSRGVATEGTRFQGSNNKVSSQILEFCEKFVLKSKPTKLNTQQAKTWRACFQSAPQFTGDLGIKYALPLCKTYLQLLDEYQHTPAAHHVLLMMERMLNSTYSEEKLLIIKKLFEDRLMKSLSIQTIVEKAPITLSLQALTRLCSQWISRHQDLVLDLLNLFRCYEREIIVPLDISTNKNLLKEVSAKEGTDDYDEDEDMALLLPDSSDPLFGWLRRPSLAWLSSQDWLEGCMQTPLLDKYDSVDDYVYTLRSMWTLLTFYWGSAALWPKCHYHMSSSGGHGDNSDRACGEPLLTPANPRHDQCTMQIREGKYHDKQRICGKAGKWKCMHHAHHTIVCEDCLKKKQEIILSACDTPDASTDIYDGKIKKRSLTHDVLILDIEDCLSRKVPKIAPNWRTTYRLKTAGLIAIVETHSMREPLNSRTVLYWGEIINCPFDSRGNNKNEDEFHRRERKQLTFRILNKSDGLPLRPMIDLPFQVGSTVAIVDLRVFVPEVISVLGTLFDSSFQEGMKRIPFAKALLGDGEEESQHGGPLMSLFQQVNPNDSDNDNNATATSEHVLNRTMLHQAIETAILSSKLKCLQYLSAQDKQEILSDILIIPSVKTLDPTQLQAFCYGLFENFHCTQGPPGTGKSFVGTCLVVALQVIRKKLISRGHFVGPIITLSYKNHALDEFLLDILASCPHLKMHNQLIRVGKPEDEALFPHAEHTSPDEIKAKRDLEARLRVLHDAKFNVDTWMNVYSNSISPFDRLSMFYQGMSLLETCMNEAEERLFYSLKNNNSFNRNNYYSSTLFSTVVSTLKDSIREYTSSDMNDKGDNKKPEERAYDLSVFSFNVLKNTNANFEDILQYYQYEGNEKLLKGILQTMFGDLFDEAIHWKTIISYDEIKKNALSLNEIMCSPVVVDLPTELSTTASHEMKLFYLWLEGYSLPPRCQGSLMVSTNDDQSAMLTTTTMPCTECATWDSNYCQSIHKCKHYNCSTSRHPITGYCESAHSCQYHHHVNNQLICTNMNVVEACFCVDHACGLCINLPKESSLDSCEKHRCQAYISAIGGEKEQTVKMKRPKVQSSLPPQPVMEQCRRLQLMHVETNQSFAPYPYCEDHFCAICEQMNIISTKSIKLKSLPPLNKNERKESEYCIRHTCRVIDCVRNTYATGKDLCLAHTCQYCDAAIMDVQPPGVQICEAHCCQYTWDDEPCYEVRVLNHSSSYCMFHTCPICVLLNLPNPQSILPDSSTCHLHPLCQAITEEGYSCANVAKVDDIYCPVHEKKEIYVVPKDTCCGITKKGNSCGAKRPATIRKDIAWYCKDHQQQQQKQQVATTKKVGGGMQKDVITLTDEMIDYLFELPPSRFADNRTLPFLCNYSVESVAICLKCSVLKCRNHTIRSFPPGKTPNSLDMQGFFWTCRIHQLVQNQAAEEREYQEFMIQRQRIKLQSEQEVIKDEFQCAMSGSTNNRKVGIIEKRRLQRLAKVQQQQGPQSSQSGMGNDEVQLLSPKKGTEDYDFVEEKDFAFVESDNQGAQNPDEVIEQEDESDQTNDIRRELYQADDDVEDIAVANDYESDDDEKLPATTPKINLSNNDFNLDAITLREVYQADFTVKQSEDFLFLKFVEKFSKRAITSVHSFWQMSKTQRHELIQSLFLEMIRFVKQLIILSEPYIDEARRDKSNANAAVFKNASVIGGTVVGASKRLGALRAAEPFAIIVEEACEVMEPTLVSVLAVESVQKLELIGDHRQLPAFVQQCWYNIERSMKSIKTSLFERMVNLSNIPNKRDDRVPQQVYCTILDIQRRMRFEVSNITKAHYLISDGVVIQDHPATATQSVGDRFLKDKTLPVELKDRFSSIRRTVWLDKGQSVPGMEKNVFFWHMENNGESRPIAGLSACNENEANAVVSLTRYLLAMHIPPSCISIITPYDGQRRLLVKKLRAVNCFPYTTPYPQGRSGHQNQHKSECTASSTITVSTVDRYQGDENDIIILSLVRTRPGNRFVSLLNRFIVATSRARLGFYIIGSTTAVAEDFHMNKPIKELPAVCEAASTASANAVIVPKLKQEKHHDNTHYRTTGGKHWLQFLEALQDDEKIGSAIPICCPIHRTISRKIVCSSPGDRNFPAVGTMKTLLSNTNDVSKNALTQWNQEICHETCTEAMICGHACSFPCHMLSPKAHRKHEQCEQLLARSCAKHQNVSLNCGDVPFNSSDKSLEAALAHWRCEIVDYYQLPTCEHSIELACYEYQKLQLLPNKAWPRCNVTVTDFVHPACGHIFPSPTCEEYQRYTTAPPTCTTKVTYIRPGCNHSVELNCYMEAKEREHPTECKEKVTLCRPRCKHPFSSICHPTSRIIQAWEDEQERSEQHYDQLEIRTISSKEVIVVKANHCYGCAEESIATKLVIPLPKCKHKVIYSRECGHEIQLNCHEAFAASCGEKQLGNCEAMVAQVTCKCCDQKSLRLKCHEAKSSAFLGWDLFEVHSTTRPIDLQIREFFMKLIGTNNENQQWWNILLAGKCTSQLTFIRECGHHMSLSCYDIQRMLKGDKSIPVCQEQVCRILSCGHTIDVSCHQRLATPEPTCRSSTNEVYTYADCDHVLIPTSCADLQRLRVMQFPCKESISRSLYRCGHIVTIPCHMKHTCDSYDFLGLQCKPVKSNNDDKEEVMIVDESAGYCLPSNDLPLCTAMVSFRYNNCHHVTRPDIPCFQAFAWALGQDHPPSCSQPCQLEFHPLCGHAHPQFPCSFFQKLTGHPWNPWYNQTPPVEITIPNPQDPHNTITNVISYPLPSHPVDYLVPTNDYEDDSMENITSQFPQCMEPVLICFADTCQHTQRVTCGEIYRSNEPILCHEQVRHVCSNLSCQKERYFDCAEYQRLLQSSIELDQLCDNMIRKECTRCHVNVVSVKCSDYQAECHAPVTVILPCGHQKIWVCGTVEEDPRNTHNANTKHNKQCLYCAIEGWKSLHGFLMNLEDEENVFQYKSFMQTRLLTILQEQKWEQQHDINYQVQLNVHKQALNELLIHLIQTLQQMSTFQPTVRQPYYLPEMLAPLEIPFPPTSFLRGDDDHSDIVQQVEEYLLQQYELVYLETDAKQQQLLQIANNVANRLRPQLTIYGSGVKVRKLTKRSLSEVSTVDGRVRVIVALAWKGHVLVSHTRRFFADDIASNRLMVSEGGFISTQDCLNATNNVKKKHNNRHGKHNNNNNNNNGGGGGRFVQVANLLQKRYESSLGYDCVEHRLEEEDESSSESVEYYFWNPKMILPMGVYTFQLHVECCICGEYFAKDKNLGAFCPKSDNNSESHFVCYQECFPAYLDAAKQPDAIASFIDPHTKQLACPKCKQGYDCTHLCAFAPEDIANDLLAFQIQNTVQHQVQQERQEMEQGFELRLQDELQKLRSMDEESREIELLRKQIVDDILTNKCPRCRMAFIDFDGCCSVTCGNQTCRAAFCGFCFTDCGRDAHTHAVSCVWGNKSLFCDARQLKELWNRRRIVRIRDLLQEKSANIKRKLQDRMTKDFRDLDLKIQLI